METDAASQQSALMKLQNQLATLKDSLTKMAALNEGLAKDKVELSRILLQVSFSAHARVSVSDEDSNRSEIFWVPIQIEGEKTDFDKRRRKAESELTAARESASQSQMEMMNFCVEKQALESSHIQLQEACQKLEAELSLLQKEKSEALEKYAQVRDCWPFTPLHFYHLEQLFQYY